MWRLHVPHWLLPNNAKTFTVNFTYDTGADITIADAVVWNLTKGADATDPSNNTSDLVVNSTDDLFAILNKEFTGKKKPTVRLKSIGFAAGDKISVNGNEYAYESGSIDLVGAQPVTITDNKGKVTGYKIAFQFNPTMVAAVMHNAVLEIINPDYQPTLGDEVIKKVNVKVEVKNAGIFAFTPLSAYFTSSETAIAYGTPDKSNAVVNQDLYALFDEMSAEDKGHISFDEKAPNFGDHFANTDWAKEMFRTAAMHQHHLSVNGGSKAVHYMISTQYFQQDGILRETANQRFNFRSNLDAQLGIVKLGLNLSGSRQNIDEPTTSVTGEGLMRYLTWFTRPTVPVRYSNGHYGFLDGNPNISQSVFKNPIEALNMGYKDNKHYRFDGKFFGEIDIIKGLKFRSSLAYKYYMNDVTTFNPKNNIRYDAEGNALTTVGTNKLTDYHYLETTYINENILTYDFSVGKHSFNLLAGHSIQATRWDKNEASKQGFATDNIYEMDGGTMNDHVTGSAEESSLQSFFGRLNYNYGGRYLLEMNVRHDGSSRMPKAHRYATFPSFSGAWIMTNEKFMENVKFLHSLKLRGSWGKLGNQEIGNYAYAATLAASGSYYFGDSKQIGMKTAKIPNENIKWETTTITDFGFDAAFWGGKINVTFDWYEKNTSDILMKLAMPGIFLGSLDAPYQNAGKVRNRGWELAANYFDQKGDWAWQAGFSLSGVKNEITDMKGVEDIKDNTINREGEAIGSYYGLKAIGIYRTQADLDRVNANGQKIMQNNQEPQLGDIMYEDIDNNGNINDADRTIIGNPFPKMQYSFNLGFSYKDFDVNTFWQGIAGVYRYNWDETTISNGGNKTSRWLDRWSESNPNGSMPRLGGTINNNYSSFWLTKGDYLRLKNLEIGYTFRQREFLTKLGVQSIRLYLAGTNLLTFTSLDDYDPEKLSTDSRNDVHPNTRTYSFGVNVKF